MYKETGGRAPLFFAISACPIHITNRSSGVVDSRTRSGFKVAVTMCTITEWLVRRRAAATESNCRFVTVQLPSFACRINQFNRAFNEQWTMVTNTQFDISHLEKPYFRKEEKKKSLGLESRVDNGSGGIRTTLSG